MKNIIAVSGLLVVTMSGIFCKKYNNYQPAVNNNTRKVRFVLYTDKDFSTDEHTIQFKLSIQNPSDLALWDSLLAPMQVKDIPPLAQKIVVEKEVPPGYSASTLKVGFYYAIEDIGNSWHIESYEPGDSLKIVDFNFQ